MRRARLAAALAAIPLFLGAFAGAAIADDVSNDLGKVDATAEQMPLKVGQFGTTVLYAVNNNDGDTVRGCNFNTAVGGELTLHVKSSDPAVATVSPETVVLSSCGKGNGVPVRVDARQAGSTTITADILSQTAPGIFNLDPVTFVVSVEPADTSPSDSTPPVIVPVLNPEFPDGEAGWYRSDVTLNWSVTDDESEITSTIGCEQRVIESDQLPTTYTCEASSAGGTSSFTTDPIKRDATPPTVSIDQVEGDLGDNGWYKSDVKVTFSARDDTSGIDGPQQAVTSVGEGEGITVASPVFTDRAGNSAQAEELTFNVDKTPPTVEILAVPDDHFYGDTPTEQPSCEAADAHSGLVDECTITGFSTAVGTHTLTATAKDNAGHTSTATATYTVHPWTINGFYSPVNMGKDVVNTVKGGSTVPLKFEVFKGDTELTDVSAISGFSVKKMACASSTLTAQDEVEFVTTGSTSLRYDPTAGQFIQNWKTPTTAKKTEECYQVTMTTKDGSSLKADFRLK